MHQWHVLYAKSHSERQVANALQARGFQVYLPLIPVARPRSDRPRTRPYFPGYLFVLYDLDGLGISQLIYTPGLKSLVTFGDEPATTRGCRFGAYSPRTGKTPCAGTNKERSYARGDPVEIMADPFREIEAIFDRRLTPDARVRASFCAILKSMATQGSILNAVSPSNLI